MSQTEKIYKVKRIPAGELTLSGKVENKLWQKAVALTDFCSPWSVENPEKMVFKALWDEDQIYFLFQVFDNQIHLNKTDNGIESIGNSDRVELFFRQNDALSPYYCLEIDTAARIMDFEAYPNKKFDFDWNWPSHEIQVLSHINTDFYTIEIALSCHSLRHFELLNNNIIETGIFRAKYVKKDSPIFEPIWISWVNPRSAEPNFHQASAFGKLILESNFEL